MANDLKVVGAGRVGRRVALLWREQYPDAKIYLKTRTDKTERSEKWTAAGFIPLSQDKHDDVRTANVVFCAPPTESRDYANEVSVSVTDDWLGSGAGNFVFTGSGEIYCENSGGYVTEDSEVIQTSKHHAKKLLGAEAAFLSKGGICLRLGSLYCKEEGVQNFWLKKGRTEFSTRSPKGLVNFNHMDDAARAVVVALQAPKTSQGKIYLVSDGSPVTRVDACEALLKHELYRDCNMPNFTGGDDVIQGRKYDISRFTKEFGWKPVFESYAKFFTESHGQEKSVALI